MNIQNYQRMCFRFCCTLPILVPVPLILGGCTATHTVYIPSETTSVRTDSTAKVKIIDRLIIERDTVSVRMSGDTLIKEVTKWRVRNTETHDTIYQAKTDTLRVKQPFPVEVIKEVPAKTPAWKYSLVAFGATAMVLLALKIFRKVRSLISRRQA